MKKFVFISIVLLSVACKKKTETAPIPKSSSKDIVSFELASLNPKVTATVDNNQATVTFLVSFRTDIAKLKPTIRVSEKATISPASDTEVDMSKSLNYTVTAEDGSTKVFKIVVQSEVRLMFYNTDKGTSQITDGKTLVAVSNTLAANWTDIVGIGTTQVLFYDEKTGKVTVADNLSFTKNNDFSIESGLYSATYLGSNSILFLGKTNNGLYFKDMSLQKVLNFPSISSESVISNALGTTKETFLFYAPTTGIAVEISIKDKNPVTNNINLGKDFYRLIDVGDGSLLAYNPANGKAAIFQNEKPFSKLKDLTLAAGYQIVNAGAGQVLFYNSATGEGMMTDNKNFAKLPVALPTSASGKWTHILSL
jgi:hypothetical protein